MANDTSCPQSDHIDQERARLKSASQRHFAQSGNAKAQQFKERIPKGPERQAKAPPPPTDDGGDETGDF